MASHVIETIEFAKIPGLHFYVVRMNYCDLHIHTEAEIAFFLSGQIRIHTMERDMILGPGDITMFSLMQAHEAVALTDDVVVAGIHFPGSVLEQCEKGLSSFRLEENSLADQLKNAGVYELVREHFFALGRVYYSNARNRSLLCFSHLFELLYLIFSNVQLQQGIKNDVFDQDRQKRLGEILSYIDTHYMENLTISEIAKQVHLSNSRVSHFFREMLQMSFQDYLMRKRFIAACGLLFDPACTVTQAVHGSGLSSAKYLNRMMKENFGLSVQEFRNHYPMMTETFYPHGFSQEILPDEEALFMLERFA